MYDETNEPTRRCLPPSRSGRVVRVGGVAAELASEVGPMRPGADDAGVAGHDAVLIFRGARASGAERSRAVVGIGEVMEQSMGAIALAANFIEGDRLESVARIGAKPMRRRGHQKSPH